MLRQARPVDFQTKFSLLWQRPAPALLSIIFTVFPLFFLFIFGTTVPVSDDGGMSDGDYDNVNERGATVQATITGIEMQENVTINNDHPAIITYAYKIDGKQVEDQFKTFAPQAVSALHIGDDIQIKHLDGKSIIPTLEPFSFPYWIIYGVFLVMLLVGIIFIAVTITYVKKHLALYRYGNVQDAKLISVTQSNTRQSRTLHVHYQYTTSRGQAVMGKSRTNDYTFMSQSKHGDTVKIFVSSENEQQSCIIPNLEAARNGWQV